MKPNLFTHADLVSSVKNQLFNTGLPLSSLYQTLNVESGNFILLPKNVIFPNLSTGINSGYLTDSLAIKEIVNYLSKDINNCVIIEYASARKGYGFLEKNQLSYFTYENYIYSIFSGANFNYEDIEKSVKSAISYQLIIGLYHASKSITPPIFSEITSDYLQEIFQQTQSILFEVCDGEGLLIWER